jgi:NAD(P)-dependent dehydrogenase (short-subunit alcohol dehydrogenase family)
MRDLPTPAISDAVKPFADRHVLVTGAANGIGLAAARAFLDAGATVWLTDRDREALDAACACLPNGGSRHAVVLDVTDETGWTRAAALIDDHAGRLDVLVNNAGRGNFCAIADLSLDEWRAVRAVNVDSLFLGTRAMMPLLARSAYAAIVNIASIRGIISGPGSSAYSAAKGAARMFGKAAALEFATQGSRIRVNTINPGLIDTPLARAVFDDPAIEARRLADIPLGRAGHVEEIAAAILFLAGDDAGYITGTDVTIDGGQTAG